MNKFLCSILFIVTLSSSNPALAQDIFFDPSQWGSVNLVARQSSGNATLESIVSSNNNLERLNNYNEDERLRMMSRPVGRLDIRFANGTFTTCTATLIADDRLLTNNHCVPNLPSTIAEQGAITDVTLLMNHYDERNTGLAVPYRVNASPLETSPSLDYSILEVEGAPGSVWGIARIRATPPRDGSTLLVIHHPGGLPKHVTRGQCRAARPATDSDKIELYHLCDTLPGSSGAPIFSDNDNTMIGIHRAGPTVASPNATNFGIMIAAIDSKMIPRSGLEGSQESAPKQLVQYTVLSDNSTFHIGDEKFTSTKWSQLVGSCQSFSLRNTGTKPKRLIVTASVYGAENTSIILDGAEYPFANQQIPAGKKRPNYWSKPVQVYLSPQEDRDYRGRLQICSNPVRAPEKPGDLDDFMIRNIVVVAEVEE